jgi:hypothetical protein
MKNIIDGEECCWRCGMSRKEVKRTQIDCHGWGVTHDHHLWTVKEDEVEKEA